jgi:hypothetical protein
MLSCAGFLSVALTKFTEHLKQEAKHHKPAWNKVILLGTQFPCNFSRLSRKLRIYLVILLFFKICSRIIYFLVLCQSQDLCLYYMFRKKKKNLMQLCHPSFYFTHPLETGQVLGIPNLFRSVPSFKNLLAIEYVLYIWVHVFREYTKLLEILYYILLRLELHTRKANCWVQCRCAAASPL